jgi:hypothetical protein
MSNANTTTNGSDSGYFDLHTRGIGYVSRIRTVKSKTPYLSCTVAMLRGSRELAAGEKREYTYIDCNVVGSAAEDVIQRCMKDDDKKVLIGCSIGDIRLETFTFEKGEKKGQFGATIKGRLLKVLWVDVDGQRVYDAPKNPPAADTTGAESDAEPEPVQANEAVAV